MSELPAPLTPADCDLRDFVYMPLDVVRLRDSDLASIPDAEAFRAAVFSWCASWHQVPAGSLPDDDIALCRLLGYGRDIETWQRTRQAGGLRGWIKCTDGRLYHPVVAEKANCSWEKKQIQRNRTAAARAARLSQNKSSSVTGPSDSATISVTDSVVASTESVTGSKVREGKVREGKVIKEKQDTGLQPGDVPPLAVPFDPKLELWNVGLPILAALIGKSPDASKAMLGKLLAASGANHVALMEVLRRSQIENPATPLPWLMANAKAIGTPSLTLVPQHPDIKIDKETGKRTVGGWFLDYTIDEAIYAARMDKAPRDLTALMGWLKSDIEPSHIHAVMRRIASRDGYTAPISWTFFDNAVRDVRRRVAA